MRKFLTVVARIIAVFFAILFVFTAIISILLSATGSKVFNPSFYKGALENEQVYTKLPGIIANVIITSGTYIPCEENPLTCENISTELQTCFINGLSESTYNTLLSGTEEMTDYENSVVQGCIAQFGLSESEDTQGMPSFLQNLKSSDWEGIINSALPPADIKSIVESTIDGFFTYLNGESASVSIPLSAIKENLSGSAGEEIVTQLLSAQPACTVDQIVQIALNAASGDTLVLCSPPEAVLLTVMPLIQTQLSNAVNKIPATIEVIKPHTSTGGSGNSGPLGSDIPANFRLIKSILRFSFVMSIIFLLLVTLFAVRSIKSWMRWWGIPQFFTGLFTGGASLAATLLVKLVWTNFIGPKFPAYLPADLASLAENLVIYLSNGIFQMVLIIALALLVVGLAAWVISYFIKTGNKTGSTEFTPAKS